MDQKISSTKSRSSNNHNSKRRLTSVGFFRKGPWSAAEDSILEDYVSKHGEGNWSEISRKTKLSRCGKSCRLRWVNHLSPKLKKGPLSAEEISIVLKLHAVLGNRWSQIAAYLPGRTDNEIKNFWNTRFKNGCCRARQRKQFPEVCCQVNYETTGPNYLDGLIGEEENQDVLQASDCEIADIAVSGLMSQDRSLSHEIELPDLPAIGSEFNVTSWAWYYSLVSTTYQIQCQNAPEQDYFFASGNGFAEPHQDQNGISYGYAPHPMVSLTCDASASYFETMKMELPSVQNSETSLSFMDTRCLSPELLNSDDTLPHSSSVVDIHSETTKENTGLSHDMIPGLKPLNPLMDISPAKSSVSCVHSPSNGVQISSLYVHESVVEADWEDCLSSPLDLSTASIFHECTPTNYDDTFPDKVLASYSFHGVGYNVASELAQQAWCTGELEVESSCLMDMCRPHDLLDASCTCRDPIPAEDEAAMDALVGAYLADDVVGDYPVEAAGSSLTSPVWRWTECLCLD
ncbi:Transcription factor MYB33-like protein [Drosera capensis]